MICLQDSIKINSTPAEAFSWFEHLDENYLLWHPEHVCCRYLTDDGLKKGAKLYIEEYLHGTLHKFTFTLTQVIKNQEFHYHITPGMRGSFYFAEDHGRLDLKAEICIGWKLPLIGRFLDKLTMILLAKKLALLQEHMNEEGLNLRRILEAKRTRSSEG